ncbi:hypothetical protein GW17_00040124 [Ensete ventricosum]|nr:hypothetical protein GW17_00040124 [Ensete ventricosum]
MRHDNYMDGYLTRPVLLPRPMWLTRGGGGIPGSRSLRPLTHTQRHKRTRHLQTKKARDGDGTRNRNRARSRWHAPQVNSRCCVNVARSPRCRHSYRTQWVCSALSHAKLWAVGLVRYLQSLCLLISVVRVHGRGRYGPDDVVYRNRAVETL